MLKFQPEVEDASFLSVGSFFSLQNLLPVIVLLVVCLFPGMFACLVGRPCFIHVIDHAFLIDATRGFQASTYRNEPLGDYLTLRGYVQATSIARRQRRLLSAPTASQSSMVCGWPMGIEL